MNINRVAHVAALAGELARTAMLLELLDGRSLTAGELARAARISAATASRHLALLTEAGLLAVSPAGRHRYHRLASAEVARMLEGMLQIASGGVPSARRALTGPRDDALRMARSCYDHIAGRLGVAIAQHLLANGAVVFEADSGRATARCAPLLHGLGIEPAALQEPSGRRAHCRPCMDWSERHPHVAGRLGALLLEHGLQRNWLARRARTLEITPAGAVALRGWLGEARWRQVALGPER